MRAFTELIIVLSLTLLLPGRAFSQNPDGRSLAWFAKAEAGSPYQRFYFYWGYNRASFARSDIHLAGREYDFTLYDVAARDRPTKFNFKTYFNPTSISIPQYNYRLGFFLTRRIAVSVGVDHLKYVVVHDQTVFMSGVIDEQVSRRYAGSYLRRPIRLSADFVRFEHTDGLNLVNLDLEYHLPVLQLAHPHLALHLLVGLGGVWVVPRTDARIFGYGLNNNFHLAGYSLAGKTGLRLYVLKRLFLMVETKAGYISLPNILLRNEQPERADQNIFFWEKMGAVGLDFNLGRRKQR